MKRLIPLVLVMLILSTTAFAAEYPSEVQCTTENGIYEIRKTYELPAAQEPSAQARQNFEQDGYSYTLTDMLRQELPQYDSRAYVETVTVDSDSKELEDVLPLLENEKAVTTEDGFTGIAKLDASSIQVEPAGYKNSTWTVTATRSYPNLSDMDLQYIPKTTVENGRTLSFDSVDWQTDNTMNVDDYAIGDRYTAVVTYSAQASAKRVTGYTVTAQYTGTVEKISMDQVRYVAIFHGTPIAPEQKPLDWRYAAIPGGLAVLAAAGYGISKFKKKRGTNNETVQDAAYEPVPEADENTQPDAGGSDHADSYPGICP